MTTKKNTTNQQYEELKKKHPDAMIIFRIGDFYELYNEDAEEASKVLGITLTEQSTKGKFCGFPAHAIDSYLPKIIRAGKRVAISDRVEKKEEPQPLFHDPDREEAIKTQYQEKLMNLARAVVKELPTISKNLNARLADYIGRTNLIDIKVSEHKPLTDEELVYLITMTRKAEENDIK